MQWILILRQQLSQQMIWESFLLFLGSVQVQGVYHRRNYMATRAELLEGLSYIEKQSYKDIIDLFEKKDYSVIVGMK